MLETDLTHPGLLRALAAAGHGARVLIADGNYPATTAIGPVTERIELSISRDLPSVLRVLQLIIPILPIEGAMVMAPPDGGIRVHGDYAAVLAPLELEVLSRDSFYSIAREPELAVIVTTGDSRHFANLMLTVGAAPEVRRQSRTTG